MRLFNWINSPKQKYAEIPLNGSGRITRVNADTPILSHAIDVIAKHFSILTVNYFNEKNYENIENNLAFLLRKRPNDYQTPTEFWHLYFHNVFKYGNGIIIPHYDKTYNITSLEVLDMSCFIIEWIKYDTKDNGYLKLYDISNKEYSIISYLDVIHTRRDPAQYQNNEMPLFFKNSIPEIINENLSVLLSELRSNFDVKGILKIGDASGELNNTMLNEDDKKKRAESLVERVKHKILVLDKGEEWEEKTGGWLKSSIEDMTTLENKFYELFGIPEGIIKCNYTFEEYMSFHTSVLEPKLKQIEEEFNFKLLSKHRITKGEKITFRIPVIKGMSFADMNTFINNMKYQGAMNNNEIRSILGFVPIDGGDVYTGNLNMANPDGSKIKNSDNKSDDADK